jgi:hypothetical protein
VSRNLRYSEDELREQWSFIDALVEKQASALRSGVQDPEEETVEAATPDPLLLDELEQLRERVRALEAERASLLERLRIAETAAREDRAQPARQPVAAVVPPSRPASKPAARSLETRVRDWWRRLSR